MWHRRPESPDSRKEYGLVGPGRALTTAQPAGAQLGLPSEHRLTRGGHFIHLAGPRAVGRVSHRLRIFFHFFGYRDHRLDELVDLVLALGLRGLDHERAVNDQRKTYGVGVES